jgi:PAS domain S-box-containing protein
MSDPESSNAPLAEELASLRRRLAALEAVAAENRQYREALAEQEAGFRRVVEQTAAGYFRVDLELRFVRVNQAWLLMHGYTSADEVVGQHVSGIVLSPLADLEEHRRRLLAGATISAAEFSVRHKNGSIGYVTCSVHPVIQQGEVTGMEGFSIDITERKRAEEQVRRTTRALRALSQSNRAMVRAEQEQELLEDVCRIIVHTAGYRAAWVAFPGQPPEKAVVPVAECGFAEGLLKTLGVTWNDTAHGRGIVGTALRTHQTIVVQNILSDPRLAPWRNTAIDMGCASCAALPILSGDQCFGALAIYAPESDAFDAAELELLADLADNLAYGITSRRVRKTHQTAQEALTESKGQLEALLRSLPAFVFLLDDAGHYLEILTDTEDMLPRSPNRGRGHHISEVLPAALAQRVQEVIDEAFRSRATQVMEYAIDGPDSRRWYEGRTTPVRGLSGSRPAVVWVVHEITARKQAEEALRRSHSELEQRVQARTAELAAANERLRAEVAERMRAEEVVQQEQRRLRQLLEVYEQHRQLIAYDIHDTVCQRLTGALMTFEGCTRQLRPECQAATREGFARVLQLLQEGIRESRRLMSGLRPPILDESGLVAAIDYLVCENQGVSGLEVSFDHDVRFHRLVPPLETAIFRIVQEGLTNAQRHSSSQRVRIRLSHAGGPIRVEIEDWGKGFDPRHVHENRFGLEGMRERVQLFGGTLQIDSQPGQGTRIRVELPAIEGGLKEFGPATA